MSCVVSIFFHVCPLYYLYLTPHVALFKNNIQIRSNYTDRLMHIKHLMIHLNVVNELENIFVIKSQKLFVMLLLLLLLLLKEIGNARPGEGD